MSMYSICTQLVADGELEETLDAMARAEESFDEELGVLRRRFLQCARQPHLIWACTEWTSERAHNDAARAIMKVREDDRVASAWFRPGLYREIFGLQVEGAAFDRGGAAEFVVVAQGLVAARQASGWQERVAARFAQLEPPDGFVRATTWFNYASPLDFVAFLEWRDEEAYAAGRVVGDRSVEEHLFVAAPRSDLAAYDQFECRPLDLQARLASPSAR